MMSGQLQKTSLWEIYNFQKVQIVGSVEDDQVGAVGGFLFSAT